MIRYKRPLIIALISVVIILTIGFFSRNLLLNNVLERATLKIKSKYNARLIIDKAYFSGFKTLHFEHITIVPSSNDTILDFSGIEANIKFFPLFASKLRLSELEINKGRISLVKKGKYSNYSDFFKSSNNNTAQKTTDFTKPVKLLLNTFSAIPGQFEIKNLEISYVKDTFSFKGNLFDLINDDGEVSGTVNFQEGNKKSSFAIKGDLSDESVKGLFRKTGKGKIFVPVIKNKWDAHIDFDEIEMALSWSEGRGVENVNFSSIVRNYVMSQPRLSSRPIVVDSGKFTGLFKVTSNSIEIDSSSVIGLNKINIHPYLFFEKGEKKKVAFKILPTSFKASDFFASLPSGIFENFEGFKAGGKLSFFLNFDVDLTKPDCVTFNTHLKKDNFKIISFGNTDFRKMNGPFLHHV